MHKSLSNEYRNWFPNTYPLDSDYLAPVVQKVDSAIDWINHYPVDKAISLGTTYPLDSDLSGG